MLPRSAGKPIFIGLGAAAILAAGTAQVQAAEPALKVTVTAVSPAKAGERVQVEASVTALSGAVEEVRVVSIKATATGDAEPDLSGDCEHGCDLVSKLADKDNVPVKPTSVTVPSGIKDATTVTVTVLVASKGTEADSGLTSIKFTPLKPDPPDETPTPTPTPTKTSDKPSPTPTKSSPDKDDDDDDDSSGSGSSGSGSGSSDGGTVPDYTPPAPNGSFGTPGTRSPQVALPPIAPPSPSVAPQASPSPESRLQNNKAPVAQDLTFERMASTQIAWLAALLVAFSLLITQLRLGRRRDTAMSARALAAAGRRTVRTRGGHRRPRRGLFGK